MQRFSFDNIKLVVRIIALFCCRNNHWFIDFLMLFLHINERKKKHKINTFRNWKESQKARKSQEAMKAYRRDLLFT